MRKPAAISSRRPPEAKKKDLMVLVRAIVSGNTSKVLEIIKAGCFRHPVLLRRYRKTRVVHTD